MKKFLAVILAVLTFFTVFAFTACSSADKTADAVIENLKDLKYEGVQSDGTLTTSAVATSETVLTKTSERLSFSESKKTSSSEVKERYNVSDGEYDSEEKETDDSRTVYSYGFIRAGQGFTYSGKKPVTSFDGVTLVSDEPETDSPELAATVNGVLISMAKAVKAISSKGDKLTVNLNALLYGIVTDLNRIFDNADGKITVGAVFADGNIKKYFDGETYAKITEALASKDFYAKASEEIYILTGGLISLPRAQTLGELDLTDFAKDFKELTKNVTKKQFILDKTKKDLDTDDNSTVITEESLKFSVSGEIVYTLNDGVISEQAVSVTASIEMSDKIDTSLSYAPDKSSVKTNKQTTTFSVSETVKYSGEKCELTDLSKAFAEYPDFVIKDGAHSAFVSFNEAPFNLYSALSGGGFNFVLKTYIDKNDNVTDVVAEAYSFYTPMESVYSKTDKSLTLSGGELTAPLTVYLRFDKHSDADGTGVLLGVEIYSTAEDRDKRRLCGLKGEYFTGLPFEDNKGNYYPVNISFITYIDNIDEVEAVTADEKLTSLKLSGYANNVDSTYAPSSGKVTVVIGTYAEPVTLTLYTGVAEDNGSFVRIGLYSDSEDAKAGSDRYELSFVIRRTNVVKTVRVDEYISIMNNQGGLL